MAWLEHQREQKLNYAGAEPKDEISSISSVSSSSNSIVSSIVSSSLNGGIHEVDNSSRV